MKNGYVQSRCSVCGVEVDMPIGYHNLSVSMECPDPTCQGYIL